METIGERLLSFECVGLGVMRYEFRGFGLPGFLGSRFRVQVVCL